MPSKEKPYILLVAELIYLEVYKIKISNPDFTNINAIETFIGSETYKEIGSGQYHDKLIQKLEKKKFYRSKNQKKNSRRNFKIALYSKRLDDKATNSISGIILCKKSFSARDFTKSF